MHSAEIITSRCFQQGSISISAYKTSRHSTANNYLTYLYFGWIIFKFSCCKRALNHLYNIGKLWWKKFGVYFILVLVVKSRATVTVNRFVLAGKWKNLVNNFSLSKVRGTFCTHVHFRVTQRKLAIFANVGVQTYKVHIAILLPFFKSVICFVSFSSTPVNSYRILIGSYLHSCANNVYFQSQECRATVF